MNLTFAAQLNKMITAGLGGAVEAPETGVAVGRRPEYTSIGPAPILTFEANSELPLKALSVNMEPIQDLHGQANPYPAGGGKNLLPIVNRSGSFNNINYVCSESAETITISGTANIGGGRNHPLTGNVLLSAGTYTFSITGNYATSYHVQNTSANAVIIRGEGSFTLDTDTTVYVGTNTEAGTTYNETVKLQIESGSTATAWSPYSNICPISGRSTVNIWREATYDTSAEQALTIQLGQTVYGGRLNVTSGVLTVEWANIASYDGETLPGEWISDRDVYSPGTTPTTGAQVCYKLAEPQTIQLSQQTINSLLGQNNVWSDADEVSLTYGNIYYTEGY